MLTPEKPMYSDNEIAGFHQQYDELSNGAIKFCDELRRHIEELILQNNINLGFPISSRVKTWESIEEKLRRVPLGIKKLAELQDLVGFRIILLFPRDADSVMQVLKSNFKIIREYDTRDRLKEDQFGYASKHFVIELPDDWYSIPTLSKFKDFKLRTEIQVRTLAQHLWAEASRNLQYKKEENVPLPLKRSIYRISALLEIIDMEFERVLIQKDNYREEVAERIPDTKLDIDLLEIVLDKTLPLSNKDTNEFYEELLSELNHFELDTPKKLIGFIERHRDEVMSLDRNIVEQKKQRNSFFSNEEQLRVEQGVYLNHTGLIRQALDNEFGRDWRAITSH